MTIHKNLFSPKWVAARIRVERFRKRYEFCPGLATPCVQFIESWLRRTDSVLEYGSGGSTPWFVSRVREVVSVENDRGWYERVKNWTSSATNLSLHLFDGAAEPKKTGGLVSSEYVDFAQSLPVEHFDLVLDDGWARIAVARKCLPLLKSGGCLVFDDHSVEQIEALTDEAARKFLNEITGYRRVTWDDGTHKTAGFFKP
jgi:SAM-dependent methyltransferase